MKRGIGLWFAVTLLIGVLAAGACCAGDDDDDGGAGDDDSGGEGGCYYICYDDDYCLIADDREACQQYAEDNCTQLQQLDFVEGCTCDRYQDCSPDWYY